MEKLQYLTDSYDEKIKRVNAIDASFSFVFLTDMHNRLNELDFRWQNIPFAPAEKSFAVNTVESIEYVLRRCPQIRYVISGGDIGNDYDPDPKVIRESYREIMAALYSLSVPAHHCIGNHDDVTGTFRIGQYGNENFRADFAVLPAEMHALCMQNNPTDENYYYIDHGEDGDGYRLVFLNTSDKTYEINPATGFYDNYVEISDRQIEWLEEDALATERKVIVFSHVPVSCVGIFGSGPPPSRIAKENELRNGDRVQCILKKHRNVIAQIAGHVHADNVNMDDDLPTVTTLCSLIQKMPGSPDEKMPVRMVGEYTETAFDVFSVKGDMLYITRFGAGEDRIVEIKRNVMQK